MPTRLLRDGILDSAAVNALTFQAEVFYRRLMSVVDDFGRFDGRAAVLRGRLYPLKLDTVREADIARWIAECEKAGLIALYAVEGKPYLLFHRLGTPRAKDSKYPPPPSDVAAGRKQMQTDENICAQTHADVPYSVSYSGTDSDAGKDPPTPRDGGTDPKPAAAPRDRKPADPGGESLPLPVELDQPVFRAAWGEWLADRRERRKPVTLRAGRQQLESLRPIGAEKAAECVRASIANQWQGLFPDKFRPPGGGPFKGGFRTRTDELYDHLEI